MNKKTVNNKIPTSKEIFQFYHSLGDNVQKAVFMRSLAEKARLGIKDMNRCFNKVSFPPRIREIAAVVILKTKLKLASHESQTV